MTTEKKQPTITTFKNYLQKSQSWLFNNNNLYTYILSYLEFFVFRSRFKNKIRFSSSYRDDIFSCFQVLIKFRTLFQFFPFRKS